MGDISAYLAEVELALVSSPVITNYEVVRTFVSSDAGYIRVRANLSNGDFLEAAEYFAVERDHIVTLDYRYQWMASERD